MFLDEPRILDAELTAGEFIDQIEEELGGEFYLPVRTMLHKQLSGLIRHCIVRGRLISHPPIEKAVSHNHSQKPKRKKRWKQKI